MIARIIFGIILTVTICVDGSSNETMDNDTLTNELNKVELNVKHGIIGVTGVQHFEIPMVYKCRYDIRSYTCGFDLDFLNYHVNGKFDIMSVFKANPDMQISTELNHMIVVNYTTGFHALETCVPAPGAEILTICTIVNDVSPVDDCIRVCTGVKFQLTMHPSIGATVLTGCVCLPDEPHKHAKMINYPGQLAPNFKPAFEETYRNHFVMSGHIFDIAVKQNGDQNITFNQTITTRYGKVTHYNEVVVVTSSNPDERCIDYANGIKWCIKFSNVEFIDGCVSGYVKISCEVFGTKTSSHVSKFKAGLKCI